MTLADLQSPEPDIDARITLRLVIDALSGLDAIHHIDGEGGPGPYVHGELCPSSIVAGRDGVGRLIAVPTRRLVGAALQDARGYLAPEKLLGDRIDQRADVFSVGVLLWEAIAGRRLFPDGSADAVVTQLVGGKVPALVCPPEAAWAAALEPLVQRALAVAPAQRWPNVRAMAARAASLTRGHLATPAHVASLVALPRHGSEPSARPGGAPRASTPPPEGAQPSRSTPPQPRSGPPEPERARPEPPPPGQIAWEHPGSSARPPRSVPLAASHARRQAKLVGAALAFSFAIALVSGYLLLFRDVPDTAPAKGSVLVTRQVGMPSAAALELLPAPTATGGARTAATASTPVTPIPPGAVAPRPAPAPVSPRPAPAPAPRPPTMTPRPPTPAPAPPPRPAVKPKPDPKDVFGI